MIYAITAVSVLLLVLLYLLVRERAKNDEMRYQLSFEKQSVKNAEAMADSWATKYSQVVLTVLEQEALIQKLRCPMASTNNQTNSNIQS